MVIVPWCLALLGPIIDTDILFWLLTGDKKFTVADPDSLVIALPISFPFWTSPILEFGASVVKSTDVAFNLILL